MEESGINAEVVQFYEDRFHQDRDVSFFSLFRHIPSVVTKEENIGLCKEHDTEETKRVIFINVVGRL